MNQFVLAVAIAGLSFVAIQPKLAIASGYCPLSGEQRAIVRRATPPGGTVTLACSESEVGVLIYGSNGYLVETFSFPRAQQPAYEFRPAVSEWEENLEHNVRTINEAWRNRRN